MQHAISSENISFITQKTFTAKAGILSRFMTWCNHQESSRPFWVGISLMVGIGTIVPITLVAIVFGASNNFTLWVITCMVNVPILVVNLAAQPMKTILPVLFSAWVVDALIILYCITLLVVK